MKKNSKIILGILSLILIKSQAIAEVNSPISLANEDSIILQKEGGDSAVKKYNENEIRFFELENELKKLKDENSALRKGKDIPTELKLTGFIGAKIEVEELSKDINEGKVKFVLSEGSLRHKDYNNWSLFYHVAKEQYFKSKMWDRSASPQNTIIEVVPRYQRAFNNEKGIGAFEFIYTSESIDNRDAIKLKPSVYYKLSDKLSLNYYTLVGREFKGGYDDYEFLELEPGFGYKLTHNIGFGVNYFLKWGQTSNEKFSERERFFKPYIWRNFESVGLGLSLWGEIGPYKNNDGGRNNNTKFGVSGNKTLTESLKMIGEVSYKREEQKKSKKDIDITLVMLGLQYSF
ncbi:OmpG porin family protein [Cetobacterium sp.]|uniref:OmpG porin family protein n=1 Tax=Cetobacterium sp. TaxID=2071632 RepID=UPI002600CBD4|nr:OmpG porin family protein [uncultured Cetobacterium sp.]